MSDDANDSPKPAPGSEARPQGPPPTPFDHPLFLPVLLFAGMVWFGYDGWINTEPDMLEHRTFNRVGFAVLTLMTGWFGFRGYGEWKQEQAARGGDEGSSGPSA